MWRKVGFRNADGSLDVILSDGRIRPEVPPEELRLITRHRSVVDVEPEEREGTVPLWSSRYEKALSARQGSSSS